MKKLTIQRSRWIRGRDYGESFLYRNSDKRMCCLGFYLRSCGVKASSITDLITPQEYPELPKQAQWLLTPEVDESLPPIDSNACSALMMANDRQCSSKRSKLGSIFTTEIKNEQQREDRIKELFAEHDVEVTFID